MRLAGDMVPLGRGMIAVSRYPFGRRDGGDAGVGETEGSGDAECLARSLMVT